MNSILRGQSIDEEGLHTLLCEVESIINGRPITRSSTDPNDLDSRGSNTQPSATTENPTIFTPWFISEGGHICAS